VIGVARGDGTSIGSGNGHGKRGAARERRSRRLREISRLLRYAGGDYDDPATYAALRRELGEAKRPVCYLAIPPRSSARSWDGFHDARCDMAPGSSSRKPFGRDLVSARELTRILHGCFDEKRIFRIRPLSRKNAVQNLVYFRFAERFPRADLEPELRPFGPDQRWQSGSDWRGAGRSTRRPEPSATWSRTTCCRCSRTWRWSLRWETRTWSPSGRKVKVLKAIPPLVPET